MKKINCIILALILLLNIKAQIAIDTLNQTRDFTNCAITGTPNSTLTMQSLNFSPLSFTLTNGDYKKIKLPIYNSIIVFDSIVVLITSVASTSISLSIDNPSPFMQPYYLPANQTNRYTVFNTNTIDLPVLTTSFTGNNPSSFGTINLTKVLVLGYYQSSTNIKKEGVANLKFNIYPNPTTSEVNVECLSFNNQPYTIIVTNTLGEVVLFENTISNILKLKTSNINIGNYFIGIFFKQKLFGTQQFIKQ